MIVSLKGKLAHVNENTVVIDVGGIGYEVIVTGAVLRALPPIGQELQLHTYFHVRDDAMLLYGFSSQEERELFHKIIGITGIGPKTGIAILSNIGPREFARAVQERQLAVLTSLPGIGKKTGERILLELKDKFKDSSWVDGEDDLPLARGGILDDAIEALVALGYSKGEATHMVRSVQHELQDNFNLQELLKLALASNSR